MPASWWTRFTLTGRKVRSAISPQFPHSRFHYWQLCDGPAERPTTLEEMMRVARTERMFPGEGGIDLVSLARAMPPDIAVSIEVPTAELARTMDASARAKRALTAARRVMAAAAAA